MAIVHLEVIGRVQGVGFRWHIREAALRGGVAGWVRNKPDGRVEIAASGSAEAVAAIVAAARTGPPGARVDTVTDLPADGLGELPRPFSVVR